MYRAGVERSPTAEFAPVMIRMPPANSFDSMVLLAARERGLGTCWTTLHLVHEQKIAALLGIPDSVAQVALIPVAHTLGTDFRPAPRKSLDGVLHVDGW